MDIVMPSEYKALDEETLEYDAGISGADVALIVYESLCFIGLCYIGYRTCKSYLKDTSRCLRSSPVTQHSRGIDPQGSDSIIHFMSKKAGNPNYNGMIFSGENGNLISWMPGEEGYFATSLRSLR